MKISQHFQTVFPYRADEINNRSIAYPVACDPKWSRCRSARTDEKSKEQITCYTVRMHI